MLKRVVTETKRRFNLPSRWSALDALVLFRALWSDTIAEDCAEGETRLTKVDSRGDGSVAARWKRLVLKMPRARDWG